MKKNRIKRKNLFIIVGAVIVLTVGTWSYFSSSKTPKYETTEVKKTTITQDVTASGEIESEEEVDLNFPVSGKLAYLAVKKNDLVKNGSYIGSLDKNILQKQIEESLKNYSLQRNTFDQTIENDNGVSYSDSKLNDAINRLLQNNQYNLDLSVLNVQIADLAKQNADLYSPIGGVVTNVYTHEGASVVSATPIVTIADPDKMVFMAKIGEADIANVAVGQDVTVTLDAFGDKKFSGKVTEVDYAATTSVNGGSKFYLVKITLTDINKMKLNMSGDVDIVTLSHSNALALPRITVQDKNGKDYVEVFDGKGIKQKEITAGIRGTGGMIEVLSGLTEGEKVIIPSPN